MPLLCLDQEDEEVKAAIELVAGEDVIWVPRDSEDAQEVARSMASVIGSRIGWEDIEYTVNWPGRSLERIRWSGADLILSAAHNSESLTHDLGRLASERHVLVVGMTQKEDLSESIEPLLNHGGRIQTIVTEVHGGRNPSVPPDQLSERLTNQSEIPPLLIPDPIDAIDEASKLAREECCTVFVTGSVYLVGRAIEEIVTREKLSLWEYLRHILLPILAGVTQIHNGDEESGFEVWTTFLVNADSGILQYAIIGSAIPRVK